MKPAPKEVKAETGTRLAVTLWGVLLLLLVGFMFGGVFALTAQAAVHGLLSPAATIPPTAVVQSVTATPSPVWSVTATPFRPTIVEEDLSKIFIYGIGQEVQVSANWRINALGIAYFHNGEWVERVYCNPMPADYRCRFPRPPLSVAEASSFNLVVREGEAGVDGGTWHYLKANASKDYHIVEWGVEGSVYKFWADQSWP